mgnify:CR=1 FL=1
MPLQYKKDAPDMKKRLMILGAGTYQVPLIKKMERLLINSIQLYVLTIMLQMEWKCILDHGQIFG